MDKRKIDFMAEREKRRAWSSSPAEDFLFTEDLTGSDSPAEAEPDEPESGRPSDAEELSADAEIPEYMRILYGADAARHMKGTAGSTPRGRSARQESGNPAGPAEDAALTERRAGLAARKAGAGAGREEEISRGRSVRPEVDRAPENAPRGRNARQEEQPAEEEFSPEQKEISDSAEVWRRRQRTGVYGVYGDRSAYDGEQTQDPGDEGGGTQESGKRRKRRARQVEEDFGEEALREEGSREGDSRGEPDGRDEDEDSGGGEPEPEALSERERRKRMREARLDEKLREPIRPMSMNRKKRKRNAILQLTAILLIGAVILAVIVSAFMGRRNSVYNLAYIAMGDLVKNGNAEAYYVRQCDVLNAESDGVFVPNVSEGDRVSAGYVVGYITKNEYVSDLTKLRNLDRVILSMQSIESLSPEMDMSKLEAARAEIAAAKKELTQQCVTGNLADCGDILVKLTAALDYYNNLLINADSNNASVSQLQKDREALAAKLADNMTPITAVQAGIVSFYITGRESAENTVYQQLAENTEGDLAAFTAGTDPEEKPASTENREVRSGEAVAKVVTDQEYYIVLNTKEAYADYQGKKIQLSPVNGRYSVSGLIRSGVGDENTLVVKASRALRSTLESSGAAVQFEVSKTEGYRVPLTALSDWDQTGRTARIALVKANTVKFVYVTVVDSDDRFAIIQNNTFAGTDVYYGEEPADESEPVFRVNDCYIINAENVREGQVVT